MPRVFSRLLRLGVLLSRPAVVLLVFAAVWAVFLTSCIRG